VRIAYCQSNRLLILLDIEETEIRFFMENSLLTSIATVEEKYPNIASLGTRLIFRYLLPLSYKKVPTKFRFSALL
jgi:hypothetical protein